MKRLFTLSMVALATLSAKAELTFVDAPRAEAIHSVQNTTINVKQTPAHFKANARKAQAEAESGMAAFLGDYVMSEWEISPNSDYDFIASDVDVKVVDNGDGTVTIENLLSRGNIVATYNAEEDRLEAQAQKIYESQSYGDIYLYPFYINDEDEVIIEQEAPITFTIDNENRFYIDNDGILMLIVSGQYQGYTIGDYYMFNQFDRTNGTMTHTTYSGTTYTYGIAWDGSAEKGYTNVYGFCGLGCAAIAIDAESGLASMENNQDMLYYPNYGLFSTTGLEVKEDGNIYLLDVTNGTYDANTNTISLNYFGLACGTTLYNAYSDVTISGPLPEPVVGMNAIEQQNNENARCFDLQGRVVSQPVKGQLYVKQGSKIMMR